MKKRWNPSDSPLRYVNPLVKAYVFLFALLSVAFYSTIPILALLTVLTFLIFTVSKIPALVMWNNIRFFAIGLYPFFVLMFLIEQGNLLQAAHSGIIYYVRFMNVVASGSFFTLTSTSFDLIIATFRVRHFKNIGLALMAALTASLTLGRKVEDIIAIQRFRGVRFRLNPVYFQSNLRSLEAIMVPVTLQAIDLSANLNVALVSRGWNPRVKPTLPPYMKLKKSDIFIAFCVSLIVFFTFYKGPFFP